MENTGDVIQLLDILYDMINDAKSVPLSSDKCMIDREEALDLMDDIRNNIPAELKKAKELLQAREEFIGKAKKDVENMMRQAEYDAKQKVSQDEVVLRAQEKSKDMLRNAEEKVRQMYQVTNNYTEDALRRAEEALAAAAKELKESHSNFRSATSSMMKEEQEKLRSINAQRPQEE